MIDAGQLDVEPLITHRFPIDEGIKAYDLITDPGSETPLGVILSYPAADEKEDGIPGKMVFSQVSRKPTDQVRIGVLGAGNFANATMLPAIGKERGLDLVGIVAATGVEGEHAAKRFGFSYASTDEQDVYTDDAINTIAILTRHHLHAQQVIAGLKNDKHVFCEKPLALDKNQLAEICAALEHSDRLLMVGFNRRFANLSNRLRNFFTPVQDPLIMHYRVNAGELPASHWVQDPEQGGGRIIGEACHFIDYLTFVADAIPVEICTIGLPDDDRFFEDNVQISITFDDGSIGTITYVSNGDPAFPKERLEVFGGGRVAVLDDFRSLQTSYQGKSQNWRSALKQDKGHQAEWGVFAEAIKNGGLPPIPYEQIFSVTMASFAAVESLRTRQRVSIGSLPDQ
jgi:predicted dehydrogenase